MFTRLTLFRSVAVAAVLLAGGIRAGAQLASSSPFLPPSNSGPASPTQNAPLEFRGLFETPDGGVRYRLVDPVKKTGVFVKLNERNPDFNVTAKQYDAGRETLVVDHEGRTLTLEIRKSKIISSGPAAQVMVPQPQPQPTNMLPQVTQSVVANPSPAEEQKRLEAVAQEVARRRALREQASTQLNQGVAPQIAVPQAQMPPAQQQRIMQQAEAQRNNNANQQGRRR
jgi:hypothetical protein